MCPSDKTPKSSGFERAAEKDAPPGHERASSSIPPAEKTNGNIPPAPWSDAALPLPVKGRAPFLVPPDKVTIHTDPSILPEEPRESRGLFELVSPVARRALELGLAAREPSFHVFVAAESDVMIEDDILRYAERYQRGRPAPPDIVYVHDFDHPAAPLPLLLPAGIGPVLVETMKTLIDKLCEGIPSIARADSVKQAQASLARELEVRNKAFLTDLEITAKHLGFGIRAVQGGVQTFPILHGKPVSAEQFDVLDESTKRALTDAEERLTSEVERAAQLVRAEGAKFQEARDEAFSKAAEALIDEMTQKVLEAFAEQGEPLTRYLQRVRQALIDDWEDLVDTAEDDADGDGTRDHDPEHATRLNRFRINLLVSNDSDAPPPVIYETNPTYPNLFGYLERRARFGALLTDFTRVRSGSLHRASGGVLIVRAADLLADPIIWERMKRILRERQIGAEDPLGPLGLYATSLRPIPVPIRLRVVLVGPAQLYSALLEADADFAALFRVKVEVEPSIPRTNQRLILLDAYLMAMAKEREWGTFDRQARAKLLDLATRLAGDQERLALSLSPLEETAAFASALAAARASGALQDSDETDSMPPDVPPPSDADPDSIRPPRMSLVTPEMTLVTVEDIEVAWRERRDRAGSAERHIRQLTVRGEVAMDTSGTRIGVVNGLSVFSAGDVDFGQPMRITAVVALGREGIIDVEREAQLGGSSHTKGVAILRGYLGRLFGQERPLSLRAQIAFEQSYGEVDGDSASSSELYAVLSALAEVGIDQGIAVTGSVNQLGEIQAIGGVCAKIEGFYDLCAARGLTGVQGVLIPKTNLLHLVVRDDVARAIAEGRFHLYAVESVLQGIEILTGLPAGERDAAGRFPAASVFGRVERRIIEIAERLREAESPGHHDAHEPNDDASGSDLSDGADFRRG
jgi:predicted ATP-dependent protease